MTVCGLVLLWSLAADVAPPNGDAAPLADRPYQGLAVQVHPGRDVLKTNTRLIHEVADLGADTVLLSVNGYQKRVESLAIQFDGPGSPTDAQWLELFAVAHDGDLRIVLMPKVLLSDPQGGAWRGKIAPSSWEAWFAQYSRFILHFARLAERGEVEVYLVGSELVSTEKHTARWRRLIGEVRGVYSGRLGYSANWDHYRGIQFWPDLDLIGLTTYYNLNPSEKAEPTVADLRAAWGTIRDEILTWRAEVDLPLLFTEAGWCSQEGCSIAPWNYCHAIRIRKPRAYQSLYLGSVRDPNVRCYPRAWSRFSALPPLALEKYHQVHGHIVLTRSGARFLPRLG